MRWHTPLQTRRTRSLLSWLTFSLFVFLSACGGGDDGGGNNPGSSSASSATNPGSVTSSAIVEPQLTPQLAQARDSGNTSGLTLEDAKLAAQHVLYQQQKARQEQPNLISSLYQGVSTEYDPTEWSVWVQPLSPTSAQPLIVGDQGNMLASISMADGGRRVAYGAQVLELLFNDRLVAYRPAFKRVLAWLVTGDANATLPSPLKVAILGTGHSDFRATSAFDKAGVLATVVTCDFVADSACAKDANLLVLGGLVPASANLESRIRSLIEEKRPLMYVHRNATGDSGANESRAARVLPAMGFRLGDGFGGNYFAKDKVGAGRSAASNLALSDQFRSTSAILNIIASDSFSMPYDWSTCTKDTVRSFCDKVVGLQADLLTPLSELRSQIDAFTRAGQNIFDTPGTDMLRYLVLWADTVRSKIVYPLDKVTKPAEFQRALIADALVAYVRPNGQAQPQLGSYATKPIATIPVSTEGELVNVTIIEKDGFTAIGRLVVPGKPVTVTLESSIDARLSLSLNTQKPGSTLHWTSNKFDRPSYLASPAISLQYQKPIQLVSPYGGTMQLVFNDVQFPADNPEKKLTVTLRVRGVAQHPFLDQSNGAGNVAAYTQALENTPHEWTEIKLPGIQVHSRIDKMLGIVNKQPYSGDMVKYLTEVKEVLFEGIYHLAGFALPNKPPTAHVLAMCNNLGWDCQDKTVHRVPNTQHINVDNYAACGTACNGNPFDISDAGLNPRGGAGNPEAHEMGHNLQRNMLNVYGSISTEVSNDIFPIHLDWRVYRYKKDESPRPKDVDKTMFNTMVAAMKAGKPADVKEAYWSSAEYRANGRERFEFYMQWVHYWADRNRTGNTLAGAGPVDVDVTNIDKGWDILTLLYMHQRQFDAIDTKVTNAQWLDKRGKLGYSTYDAKPSFDSALGGNDNLLIVLSLITQRDQRPTFDLWGVEYSNAAKEQVASFAFVQEPPLFYVGNSHVDFTNVKKVDMTVANPVWPFK